MYIVWRQSLYIQDIPRLTSGAPLERAEYPCTPNSSIRFPSNLGITVLTSDITSAALFEPNTNVLMRNSFDSNLNWIEMNWTELNWTELNWIELNWIELNWIEWNWIELRTELNNEYLHHRNRYQRAECIWSSHCLDWIGRRGRRWCSPESPPGRLSAGRLSELRGGVFCRCRASAPTPRCQNHTYSRSSRGRNQPSHPLGAEIPIMRYKIKQNIQGGQKNRNGKLPTIYGCISGISV